MGALVVATAAGTLAVRSSSRHERGAAPDVRMEVGTVGHHPPRPKDVVCLEDYDWARRQDIGPDRGYTSVVDGPVGVAHKVTVAP